jgi:hypothetical protein
MIKKLLLKWLLKETWHSCRHEWEIKAVKPHYLYRGSEIHITEKVYECKKCGVTGWESPCGLVKNIHIIIDPSDNHPYKDLCTGNTRGVALDNK